MTLDNLTGHGVSFITPASLKQRNIEKRKRKAESARERLRQMRLPRGDLFFQESLIDDALESLHDGKIPSPPIKLRRDDLDGQVKTYSRKKERWIPIDDPGSRAVKVGEAISRADFDAEFSTRRRYEVDAGRDMHPVIFDRIFSVENMPDAPQTVKWYNFGAAGVVFKQFVPGAQVQMAQVGESNFNIEIVPYATGIAYDQMLVRYNQTAQFSRLERQFGVALNALHNHIHMQMLIGSSIDYTSKTIAASSQGDTLVEKYHNTFSAAVRDMLADNDDKAPPPYVILCSIVDAGNILRAMTRVPQEGVERYDPILSGVESMNIVTYDGWAGGANQLDGNKVLRETVNYPGVTSGSAYIFSLANQDNDFVSIVKVAMEEQRQEGDITRLVDEIVTYQTHFGAYANPLRAGRKVTLPS